MTLEVAVRIFIDCTRSSERLSFLKATRALLTACPHLHDPITVSRLARAAAPLLAVLLSTKSQAQEAVGNTAFKSKNRKGKKRARGYEGDEIFNITAEVICNSKVDGDVLLASIDGEYTRIHVHDGC